KVLSEVDDKQRVIFSNGSRDMLEPLVEQSRIAEYVDNVISVDDIKQYKPSPAAYMQVLNTLGIDREEILFMSSNGWDISGAKSFGFKTVWINRSGPLVEVLILKPDYIFKDLNGILDLLYNIFYKLILKKFIIKCTLIMKTKEMIKMDQSFKAVVVDKNEEVNYGIQDVTIDDLSEGEVLIKVAYSSVNYKDMLAVQDKSGIIRNYPMIPGIDLSGTVVESSNRQFKEGEEVLVTGFDTGVNHTGGFAEYAKIPAEWIVPLPVNLTLKDAMVFGTAGFTAALSVAALENNGMNKDNNPAILVTGSTGGVGSVALQILSKSGYTNISALVRKDHQKEVAMSLGATDVIFANELGNM